MVIMGIHNLLSMPFAELVGDKTPIAGSLTDKSASEFKASTSAYKCEEALLPQEQLEFLSQSGEDKTLLKLFEGLCNGTYIEMGALDGKMYSNSFVFNQGYGWKGVLIEAKPQNYARLEKNRKNEIATVHAAVCKEKKTVHWVTHTGAAAIGGIYEFADKNFLANHWSAEMIAAKQPIQCEPLGDLLEQYAPTTKYFDFFSLDVEGAEWEVLSSIDWDKHAFGILFYETSINEHKNLMMRSLLEANGYRLLMEQSRSHWFVNVHYASIYQDVSLS